MQELIYKLEELTQLNRDAIRRELSQRLSVSVDEVLAHPLLEQTLYRWIMELWSRERNDCDAKTLWHVDQKYSKILAKITVQDFLTMLGASQSLSDNEIG